MKYNPFKPGAIIHPGMFAGRLDEIDGFERLFFQTKNGNSSSFIITGERGIGKSSLLVYLDYIARGLIKTPNELKFNFIIVSISLDQNDSYEDIIYKIAREFDRTIRQDDKIKAALKGIWDFITNWEVMGVKYNKEKKELSAEVMLEEISEKICAVLSNTKNEKDGMYVFIDEADKPIKNPNLGVLIKYLTERLQKKGIGNFGIGIIGLPEIRERIMESHESALRILHPFPLRLLTKDESDIVAKLGLAEAKDKNGKETKIDDEAKELVYTFSEGYPHFIQQYCYSAFEIDNDDNITSNDVMNGLLGDTGALRQLGEKYFDRMFYREVISTNYRKVLYVMAQTDEEYITKQQIMKNAKLGESIVTNAINSLNKKGIIIRKKGSKGSYKISSRSFKAWILAFSKAEEIESKL